MLLADSPINGTGIGLRRCHYQHILTTQPNVPWFEALTDNYLYDKTESAILCEISTHYPIVLHGVGLSLGSTDPIDSDYCQRLKSLATTVDARYISDHLSWSSSGQHRFHDLLPLPFTEEAIQHVVTRIRQVQDSLQQPILIENPSRYLDYTISELTEWEFMNAIADAADCFILLDINNVYVTAHNQRFDPVTYIQQINPSRVKQFHLAGYTDKTAYLFDTHDQAIHTPVWQLYQTAVAHFGYVPTLIERDDNIPAFDVLLKEARRADKLAKQVLTHHGNTCTNPA